MLRITKTRGCLRDNLTLAQNNWQTIVQRTNLIHSIEDICLRTGFSVTEEGWEFCSN
jgi:hypothetical protein